MQSLKKNLLYWGRTLEIWFLAIMGALFIICVMTEIDNLSNIHMAYLEGVAEVGFLYAFLMTCIFAFSGAISYFPFTVSMGSIRRHSFIAFQIMLHVIELQLGAVIILARTVLGTLNEFGKISSMYIVLGTIMLLGIAGGNFISAVTLRFDRTVGIMVYIVTIILMAGGVAVAVALDFQNLGKLFSYLLQGPILVVALVLDIISIALHYKVAKKVEVRI